jgi:hypothetical protein
VSSFRKFPPEVEEIAREWRQIGVTKDNWTITNAPNKPGEANGFWVRSTSVSGYAKPGRNQPPVSQHCRAAHEKISADLAFDVELPVPPAVLWERKLPPAGCETCCVISALPFANPHRWDELGTISARFEPLMGRLASAMAVFDTWIHNSDRHNAGNLIVTEDMTHSVPILRIAYIDYANTLSLHWSDPVRAANIAPVGVYPVNAPPDVNAMREVIAKIEALQGNVIESIVSRVPPAFLPEPARTNLATNGS